MSPQSGLALWRLAPIGTSARPSEGRRRERHRKRKKESKGETERHKSHGQTPYTHRLGCFVAVSDVVDVTPS